jgi:cysteinyl-tRNA synthetase
MLKLYNTMTREKEIFRPLGPVVKMYFCGPTVYNYAHIGNLRSYLVSDLLRRYIELKGFKLDFVMNLTDVDDKTIRDSRQAGMSLKDFTEKYSEAFFVDIDRLRIKRATIYPKATEYIKEMEQLINMLMKNGFAYIGEDGSVYFSIDKFDDYGKLAKLDRTLLKSTERVKKDEYEKEHAQDFALWKAWDESDGDVHWDINVDGNIIRGRPGWHIECSCMSMKNLGETIDIHGGGVDLIFPHHENEIAQSEAATGKEFVKYWVHCEHLLVDGRKMSKSLGNFFTLPDIIKKGCDTLAFRYLVLSTHYRSQLNFTIESCHSAAKTVESINDFYRRLRDAKPADEHNEELMKKIKDARKKFEEHMDDDLNIPAALGVFFEFENEMNRAMDSGSLCNKSKDEALVFINYFNEIFDIFYEEGVLTEEENELIQEREMARKKKDYKTADAIRKKLSEMGILLEDSPDGVRWKKK